MPWEMAGAGLVKGPGEGEAKSLTGAGATFPAPLYTKWFEAYNKLANVQINYQSIGSGGGIKALTDNTADFGASDAPMTEEQLSAVKGEVLHIPMTLGAVVATYNIPELSSTRLKFSGETLAGIFMGDIKKWNDAKIAAENAGVSLPDKEIVVVHRSDGSGTSFIWTDFLSSTSDKWKSSIGKGTAVNWPTGLGGKGNEGVSGEVKQNPYSIGYVELAYAMQNKLPVSLIKNKAGQFVEPTLESTTAAAAGAAANMPTDLRVSIVNPEGATAYPIASFTWILVRQELADKAKATALTRALWWATHDGQKLSSELLYAPLPASVVERNEQKIKAIVVAGQPAFPGR
jgi:phosphate transport system substrate-binding protein